MTQLTLLKEKGKFVTEKEKSDRDYLERKRQFYRDEIKRLKDIKKRIKKNKINEDWVMDWWYCNHIKGWNNKGIVFDKENTLSKDSIKDWDKKCWEYDGVPENEYLAESIRIDFRKRGRVFDKKFALERLNKGIEGYEKMLDR